MDGRGWKRGKDGFIHGLSSAEITAKMKKGPGVRENELTKEYGEPFYDRIEAKATPEQKDKLKKLSGSQIRHKDLAGEEIKLILTNAPGNNASIGGVKVVTENGWFAARPSGTEDIYQIYSESFLSKEHWTNMIDEAHSLVDTVLK